MFISIQLIKRKLHTEPKATHGIMEQIFQRLAMKITHVQLLKATEEGKDILE
jgi:hypothetical protein